MTEKISEQVTEALQENLDEKITRAVEMAMEVKVKESAADAVTGMKNAATEIETTTRTYAAAVSRPSATQEKRTTPTLELKRIEAKEGLKELRILINIGEGAEDLKGKANVMVTEILNTRLEKLKTTTTSQKHKFVRSKMLANGGLIVETNTKEAATWICEIDDDLWKVAMGRGITKKPRTWTILVEFVPITFNFESSKERYSSCITELAELNECNPKEIESLHWAKNPDKRHANQEVAYMIIKLNNLRTANEWITKGVRITGSIHRARKSHNEPIRCNKCQGFGHVIAECLGSQRPRCEECTEEHNTRDCKLGPNDKRTCYNCK
ncbi:hypothetical protein DL96DRAFT_1556663 [Flagelloscypha sp. PMI_526]|nr:hypothetical protein DL96DRAFT_1556663 [Flagelloscypha sp. PMI_526]